MNKKLTILGGGATCVLIMTLALLISSTAAMAQDYQRGYQVESYQDSQTQDKTYVIHYRPRKLPLPPVKSKSPVDLLEESINKVIRFLSEPQPANLDQITRFLKKEITPHFDFNYMSRWVAGRYYRSMSPDQQRQFNEVFTELFITTFVQKMSAYRNYPPVVGDFRSRRTSDTEATATAKIFQETGGTIQVDFKFIKTSRGWKVIDVRANGVSALLYYRNYFAEQIRRREQHRAVFN